MAVPGDDRSTSASLPEVHRRIRDYWERTGVPARARGGVAHGPIYRFTEGPPTANGLPHIGHVIGRTLKDTYLRYRRMQGFRIVSPMAGWDCHGLPVELEIEKRHGLKSKQEIEAYGVEKFCDECRSSALETIAAWREMSTRLGYWLDYDRAYATMAPSYIESVWWSLRQLFDRGLLEKGHYVLPYCPRCETTLSSHEVAQGYQEASDPSVTVRFRLDARPGEPATYLLVWTTTPWTLPSNLLIAARADLTYVAVREPDGSEYLLAEPALPRYRPEAEVVRRLSGSDLNGRTYRPVFPFTGDGPHRYRVVLDDMVDAKEGTGFVHIAPSFGPDDERIGRREGVGLFDPLDSRGVFGPLVPPVQGRPFKSADKFLQALLREQGDLVQEATVRHTYPFCWRCGTALLYRARDSWFVRTSRFNAELVANNRQVEWHPAHLRDGRFGNFLTEAKDWALSRSRYWGTPLPIWVCDLGHPTCIGSFEELARVLGQPLPAGFDPHRVTVDRLTFPCPKCGGATRREPYTVDAWYDSGSAPFAQFHHPFEASEFDPAAPNGFVAEGIDQTRGWFYTLLVLSTSLFHRPAYRVAISNGHALDPTGLKMSKSKGNAIDPMALLAAQGGDAVRWSFLIIDHTEPLVASEAAVRQTSARTLGTLLNVVEFYRQNARMDGFPLPVHVPPPKAALDRWLLSRLDGLIVDATAGLEGFEAQRAAVAVRAFVDDLSTWYLRRSRPRFWAEEDSEDKRSAADCLAYALRVLARVIAPLAPHTAEFVYGEVGRSPYDDADDSVHLTRWPEPIGRLDPDLDEAMATLRGLVEVGRELRQRAGVKSRIPLAELVVAGVDPARLGPLGPDADRLLLDELNVRSVRWTPSIAEGEAPDADWVRRDSPTGPTMAMSRRPTPELLAEGYVREVLRRLQLTRKELGLRFDDRIAVRVYADVELFEALEPARDRVRVDLLCDVLELLHGPGPDDPALRRWEIDGHPLAASVSPVAPTTA